MRLQNGLRRTSKPLIAVLWLLATASWAQNQRPLPSTAPQALIATNPRVHIRAHEDLDPDRLRALARPGVTLWLTTQSNTLRASTLENVARYDEAWVQLREPIKPVDANVFARIPRAGLWLEPGAEGVVDRIPGARRWALRVHGAWDDRTSATWQRTRPAEISWTPGDAIDLLSWAQFQQLPGRKLVVMGARRLLPVSCGERTREVPSAEVHLANLLALSSDVFPCGFGTRVVLEPTVDMWLLQSVLVRDPSVELVVEVGLDSKRAIQVKALLDRLEFGPSR
jgi:hypothetical protein